MRGRVSFGELKRPSRIVHRLHAGGRVRLVIMESGARLRVLLAVIQAASSPGPRYRVLQYIPSFEAAGFDCTVWSMQTARSTARSVRSAELSPAVRLGHRALTWVQGGIFAARVARAARRFDRVLLYRIPVPSAAVPALERWRPRILSDFDDALDAAEGETRGVAARLRQRILRRGLFNLIRVSRVTITSNQRNADLVRAAGGRPAVVPTSIDTARVLFRDRRELAGPLPVVGWMGTPSTAPYLRAIEAPLVELKRRRPAIVRLVGAGANPFAGLDADIRPWRYDSEAADLHGFDIGLMPMPDTPWTRGKAALKALQYAASGAPTVASWTATNVELLGEDAGTVFCHTSGDWVAALDDLLGDNDARSSRGRRGRQLVDRCYSVAVNAPRLIDLIRE